jgi:hypothetical protein
MVSATIFESIAVFSVFLLKVHKKAAIFIDSFRILYFENYKLATSQSQYHLFYKRLLPWQLSLQ